MVKKVKADIALHRNPISELRDVTCHMGSHSVTCHPTQVNVPRLTPAMQAGTRFTYPWGMEGWVDLVDLIVPANQRPFDNESDAELLRHQDWYPCARYSKHKFACIPMAAVHINTSSAEVWFVFVRFDEQVISAQLQKCSCTLHGTSL